MNYNLQHNKMQRKEQKRAKIELKEKSSEEQRTIVTQVLEVQSFLESMSDEVKEDFRKEANGAIVSICVHKVVSPSFIGFSLS